MTRCKAFTVTVQAYTEEEYILLKTIRCTYSIVAQYNSTTSAPERYLLCYFAWRYHRNIDAIKRLLPERSLVASAGWPAYFYRQKYSKQAVFFEQGTLPDEEMVCGQVRPRRHQRSTRSSVSNAVNTMKLHGLRQAVADYPFVFMKYHTGLTYLHDMYMLHAYNRRCIDAGTTIPRDTEQEEINSQRYFSDIEDRHMDEHQLQNTESFSL